MTTLNDSLLAYHASLVPMLLNMNMCYIREDNHSLLINYYLDGVEGMRDIGFDELEGFQPGLTNAIRELYKYKSTTQFTDYLRATVAHIAGNYKDLTSVDPGRNYPYVACLKTVNSVENLGSFLVQGLIYKTLRKNNRGVPSVELWGTSGDFLILSHSHMEAIWPNSTKYISIMVGLGYSPEDMAKEIQKGILEPTIPAVVDLPSTGFGDSTLDS